MQESLMLYLLIRSALCNALCIASRSRYIVVLAGVSPWSGTVQSNYNIYCLNVLQ